MVPPIPAGAGASEPSGLDVGGAVGAVAGLARQVDELQRVVRTLLGLPERIDGLAQLATDLADAMAALTARRAATPCPSWLLLPTDTAEAGRMLDELAGWLTAVYLRYPDGVDTLPECWLWHPDVIEELLWLMHAWAAAYQGSQASVAAVGDWHDRQRPGVVRRIRQSAGSCSFENHQTRAGWDRRPSEAPEVPGVEHLASVAAWWGNRRDEAAPEPTVRVARGGAR